MSIHKITEQIKHEDQQQLYMLIDQIVDENDVRDRISTACLIFDLLIDTGVAKKDFFRQFVKDQELAVTDPNI